jgi:hypothetical protein
MADNIAITPGAGVTILTDDCTTGHAQVIKLAISTDGSATLIPGDATNGLDVDVTRVSGTVAVGDATNAISVSTAAADAVANASNRMRTASAAHVFNGTTWDRMRGDITNGLDVDVTRVQGIVDIEGNVAHDEVDSGLPLKLGMRAIAHGTNPTAVSAADRTDWFANRAGVPWVMGGHPNIVTYGMLITTAISNTVIGPTVAAGLKFVATFLQITTDNANTVFPSAVVGFGTASTPAFAGTPGTLKVLGGHPGLPAGGGFTVGDGSGMIGVGADDEEVRMTTVGNVTGMYVVLKGYTVES